MGNMIPAQVICERSLNRPELAIAQFRALVTGNIRQFYIWGDNVPLGPAWYFNVRLSGVGQWLGADRLTLSSGALDAAKLDLAIPIVRGAPVHLDLELPGLGTFVPPIQFLMVTEES